MLPRREFPLAAGWSPVFHSQGQGPLRFWPLFAAAGGGPWKCGHGGGSLNGVKITRVLERSQRIWRSKGLKDFPSLSQRLARRLARMEDAVTRLVLLPNSLLCASVGATIGGWLGALGVRVDGESHFLLRGAYRGAISFGAAGWKLPETILRQAAMDSAARNGGGGGRLLLSPSVIPSNPVQLQLDLPRLQHYSAKLQDIRMQHAEEVKKLREVVEFHQRKAEDAILAAAAASAKVAELQSLFELEESSIEKQLVALSRNRSARAARAVGRPRLESGFGSDDGRQQPELGRQMSPLEKSPQPLREVERADERPGEGA